MGYCLLCDNETNDSAEIYQANFVDSTTTTTHATNIFVDKTRTTTVERYKDVVKRTVYCCKNCRRETRGISLCFFILSIVDAGLLTLCIWGGPWYEHLPSTPVYQLIKIACVLGAIVFGFLLPFAIGMAIRWLVYPYASAEEIAVKHLSKPENNNGHVYLPKAEGDKLKRI